MDKSVDRRHNQNHVKLNYRTNGRDGVAQVQATLNGFSARSGNPFPCFRASVAFRDCASADFRIGANPPLRIGVMAYPRIVGFARRRRSVPLSLRLE
ncbi:hypothetical protein [Solimonas terrae]|uniref:Uncharacterized protein n=1 Tax=Solimonas terrae TaxID=1396819 RepID=A0A6M2BTK2_9GAMM|nr:hypothetical protein [Solimonas terrae]NGY05946.1 hypothetical protein [Solimonas terrae]